MEKKFPVFDRESFYDEFGRLININAGMEVHDAASLVNLVAAEYKIKPKDSSEDPHITSEERLPSDYKTLFSSLVKDKLGSPEFAESFVGSISDEIYKNLPQYPSQPGQEAEFPIKVQEFISNLDIGEVQLSALLKMENGVALGYKDNINHIISDLVSAHLHDQGLINDPQIDLCRARIKIENSIDSEDGSLTIDAIKYLEEKAIQEYGLKYIIDNNMRLDTFDTGLPESPIDYARKKNIKINGMDPLEYALENGYKVNGEHPLKYAIDNDIDLYDLSIYAIKNDLKIDGMLAVDYFTQEGISIMEGDRDISPIEYALENGYKVNGEHALKYAIDNDITLYEYDNAFEYAYSKFSEYPDNGLGDGKFDLSKYVIEKDLKIDGMAAVDYLEDQQITIQEGDKFIPPREYNAKIKASQIAAEAQRLVRSGKNPNGQDIQKKLEQKRGIGS